MKKFSMFITLCIATLLLISCSNTKDKNNISTNDSESKKSIIPVEEYNVLTYMQSFSGSSSYGEENYIGPELHYKNISKKENMSNKKENILNNDISAYYDRTTRFGELSYEVDVYCFTPPDDGLGFISYNSDTQEIVEFSSSAIGTRSYISPITADSTEEDYVKYARDSFEKLSGVSTDGWSVKVSTQNDTDLGKSDKFVKLSDSKDITEYTFTFYKTLGDVERFDKMYIKMTNFGEIFAFNSINYEEAFEPFSELNLSREKIEKEVWGNVFVPGANSSIKKFELVPYYDEIWAEVWIEYTPSHDDMTRGTIYVFKVAELE